MPLHVSSYVGFWVYPPTYPTEVLYTPGTRQNIFSVPQKHPVANTHVSRWSGKGPLIGLPRTKCSSVTRISSWRPGRASDSATSLPFAPPSIAMSCSMRSSFEADAVVRTRGGVARVRPARAEEEPEAARGATAVVTFEATANMVR